VLTPETALPFAFLSYAALELPCALNWKPQIFHCHDWPAALVPVALRWHRHYRNYRERYDTVTTIHNLAHQGILSASVLDEWGLDRKSFNIEGLEFFGQANFLKGAIVASDMITTVSPRYSWEIQTHDGGMGLDGILSKNREKLLGVVNGLDREAWDPASDAVLPASYGPEDLSGKALCRAKLLETCRWEEDNNPILSFVGRLVEQKGVEILIPAVEEMLARGCRLVIVGNGFPLYERSLEDLAQRFPNRLHATIGFNESLARLVYAGSDIFLMPSLFEPCGLSQLIALRYGTVPVVRAVGGLADTVIDADGSEDGYGFLFADYDSSELLAAVDRALLHYSDREDWKAIQRQGMIRDFSWAHSAGVYRDIYLRLLGFDEEE
jgi:starch synthase